MTMESNLGWPSNMSTPPDVNVFQDLDLNRLNKIAAMRQVQADFDNNFENVLEKNGKGVLAVVNYESSGSLASLELLSFAYAAINLNKSPDEVEELVSDGKLIPCFLSNAKELHVPSEYKEPIAELLKNDRKDRTVKLCDINEQGETVIQILDKNTVQVIALTPEQQKRINDAAARAFKNLADTLNAKKGEEAKAEKTEKNVSSLQGRVNISREDGRTVRKAVERKFPLWGTENRPGTAEFDKEVTEEHIQQAHARDRVKEKDKTADEKRQIDNERSEANQRKGKEDSGVPPYILRGRVNLGNAGTS